jgi:hypothetical protein
MHAGRKPGSAFGVKRNPRQDEKNSASGTFAPPSVPGFPSERALRPQDGGAIRLVCGLKNDFACVLSVLRVYFLGFFADRRIGSSGPGS